MEFPAKTPDELASDLTRCDKVTLKFDNENHTLTPKEVEWLVTGLVERKSQAAAVAAVEPAGLRSLRHLLGHMPDKDLHLRRFDAQQLLQFIDAILAVRLDEAAIRKDEREKCAKIADAFADRGYQHYHAVRIASAIRNGGKQP